MAATTSTTTVVESKTDPTSYELTTVSPGNPGETSLEPRPEDQPHTEEKLDGRTYLKLLSTGFCFFLAGVNDGSMGPLIPYIIRGYGISTAIISSVYAANFAGWLLAALSNTHMTQRIPLGAMLVIGAALQVLAQALRFWKPPFPLLTLTFFIVSLGQAYQDTHGNTFVASLKGGKSHRWLAFIHAMYSAGCFCGPFAATAVSAVRTPSVWYLFYTIPLGLGAANLVLVTYAFRDQIKISFSRNAPIEQHGQPSEGESEPPQSATRLIKNTFSTPSVWLMCMFFFFYLGASLTASGWVVEYLVVVRNGELSEMGYVSAGYAGGGLLGRILLAEPPHRYGERRVILGYLVVCVACQLLFWLLPNIIAASVAISLLGFFAGPLFATGVSVGSKLFPVEIRSTALAFVFVFAQMGGSIFPIVTGVVAARAGVAILQPVLAALLVAAAISWVIIPKPKETENPDLHQE